MPLQGIGQRGEVENFFCSRKVGSTREERVRDKNNSAMLSMLELLLGGRRDQALGIKTRGKFGNPPTDRVKGRRLSRGEGKVTLTGDSPSAHLCSPCVARLRVVRRHGGGEREGELDADFTSFLVPSPDTPAL
jgi:hypothetical protein